MISKPIVFTDFHHSSLLHSFILLFEKRLGGTVFRPIGTEWESQGYWKAYVCLEPVKEFLEFGTPLHNQVIGREYLNELSTTSGEFFLCQDYSGFVNKAITFGEFFKLPVDIVIASLPEHIEPFKQLCKIHPNKPKLIYQIGNHWPIEAGLASNVMASAIIKGFPKTINSITYHQEFDLSIFSPDFSKPSPNIFSFVNCFNVVESYASDWQLFEDIEKRMPGWSFKSYGGECRDGRIMGENKLAQKMKEARFIWHTKFGGDGFGHIIYNSAAVARPMIIKMEYYQNRMGEELMIDGETCIAIDGLTSQQIVKKILYFSEKKRYKALCKNIFQNFKEKVNFKNEEISIKKFIQKLL